MKFQEFLQDQLHVTLKRPQRIIHKSVQIDSKVQPNGQANNSLTFENGQSLAYSKQYRYDPSVLDQIHNANHVKIVQNQVLNYDKQKRFQIEYPNKIQRINLFANQAPQLLSPISYQVEIPPYMNQRFQSNFHSKEYNKYFLNQSNQQALWSPIISENKRYISSINNSPINGEKTPILGLGNKKKFSSNRAQISEAKYCFGAQ